MKPSTKPQKKSRNKFTSATPNQNLPQVAPDVDRNGIRVRSIRGDLVTQSSLVEIKTTNNKASHRNGTVKWDITIPQLVLSGTPHLMTGIHQNGNFIKIVHMQHIPGLENEGSDISRRWKQFGRTLERLGVLLESIRNVVQANDQKSLALVYHGGSLNLYERSPKPCLPTEWADRFQART